MDRCPSDVSYLKSDRALVKTEIQPTWSGFLEQQRRWTAKSTAYSSGFTKMTGLLIFLMNMWIPLFYFGWLSVFPVLWVYSFIVLKMAIDLLLIQKAAKFLKQDISPLYYLLIAVLYPLYLPVLAIMALIMPFHWKDRRYKR
jgi:hypothetical protein